MYKLSKIICKNCNSISYKHSKGIFCSIKCALNYRNRMNNPAKRLEVREKMSNTRKIKMKNREIINWTEKGMPNITRIKISEQHKKMYIDNPKKLKEMSNRVKQLYKEGILNTKKENNGNWQGGITPLNLQIRNSNEYIEWTHKCLDRDKFTCQKCGKKGSLDVHHIKTISSLIKINNIHNFEDVLNCNIFWDISNGVSLCRNCHKNEHKLI